MIYFSCFDEESVINGTTFSSNYHRPNATLSGGNLTVSTTTTGYQTACSIDAKASGRWYFEATVGAGFASGMEIGVGVVDYRQSMTTYAGSTAGAPGGQAGITPTFSNFPTVSTGSSSAHNGALGSSFAAGDIISIEYDADAGTLRGRLNGGSWTTAYSVSDGGSQPKFPFAYVSGNGCSVTLNFGSTAFAYSPPSGATGWTKNSSYAGRYWRKYIRAGAPTTTNVSMAEIELRLTSGGADQTGSGTPSASSVFSSPTYTADKAVDNSSSTIWHCGNGAAVNSHWQYDFGSGNSPAIKQVSIQIRPDTAVQYAARWQMLLSSDGTVFYPAGHYEPTFSSFGETQTFLCADE
jgi:hypothetical protein